MLQIIKKLCKIAYKGERETKLRRESNIQFISWDREVYIRKQGKSLIQSERGNSDKR